MGLSPPVAQAFVDLVNDTKHVTPSKSSISRWRVVIDGAMMLVTQDINAERHEKGLVAVMSIMAHAYSMDVATFPKHVVLFHYIFK